MIDTIIFPLDLFLQFNNLTIQPLDLEAHPAVYFSLGGELFEEFFYHVLHLALDLLVEAVVLEGGLEFLEGFGGGLVVGGRWRLIPRRIISIRRYISAIF